MLNHAILLLHDRGQRRRFSDVLGRLGLLTESIRGSERLWQRLVSDAPDLVIISRALLQEELPDLMSSVCELPDAPDVVVVSEQENPDERAALLAQGCVAVLYQELSVVAVRNVLDAIIERRRRRQTATVHRLRTTGRPALSDFSSRNVQMQDFLSVVRRVVSGNATLLILGETGVGKERLAQAIHNESPRSSGPFVAVNCAALSESLLESELFGHEEGAFTGASRSRRGCFELAHRGTLFLDEIGEMPLHLQVKLLRVLQERVVQRVGGERSVPIDVRVMAASNRNIAREVDDRKFRQDLYYRLSVVTLEIPGLRERPEDIPDLVAGYVSHFCGQMSHHATAFSRPALDAMCRYTWPGNVRELINVVERAMLLAHGSEITQADLPPEIRGRDVSLVSGQATEGQVSAFLESGAGDLSMHELVACVERHYLMRLLSQTGGRVGETAERAGIDPRVLYQKLKRLGINRHQFRNPPEIG